MDFYFQGLAWFNKGITPDNIARARSFFDRALSADPDYVDALVGSASADVVEGELFFATDRIAAFKTAEDKLIKAMSSVPDHARGRMYFRGSSRPTPTARRKVSPSVNMRWR